MTNNIDSKISFDRLAARWLVATRHERDEKDTGRLYELHVRAHLAPHFKTAGNVTKATVASYISKRLSHVKRSTVVKELSTLRMLMRWAADRGYVHELPDIPAPPVKARGTAYKVRRRGAATELTELECRDVINALPEWSTSKKVASFPIRARFIVAYETSLRPATLDALEVGVHYTRGAPALRITEDIDKARFERKVPLSAEARAALDAVLPESGRIFGRHDYRDHLAKAARAVLPDDKAKTFASYDFRHARITQIVGTGNLTGAMFLAGHKQLATTSRYTRPNQRAAERALQAVGPTGFAVPQSVEVLAGLLPWGFKSPPSHKFLRGF